MGLLSDPYVVAELIGAAFGAGSVGYLLARKAFPQQRTARVARLMDAAGVADDAPAARSGFRPPPIVIAFAAAVAGAGLVAGQTASKRLATDDLPKLRAGFLHGCSESCVKAAAPEALCNDLCGCAYSQLEADLQTKAALAAWFNRAAKQDEAALAQLREVQGRCLEQAKSKLR